MNFEKTQKAKNNFQQSKMKKNIFTAFVVLLFVGCSSSKDFDCEGVGLRVKGDKLFYGAGDYKLCEKYELFSVYKLIGDKNESTEITCRSEKIAINFYQITNKVIVKSLTLVGKPEDEMSCLAK
jgi:hypothetical protein